MPRETYSPAKDPDIHELIARGSALIGSLDVIRKARCMPSFTDDMNAYWTWCQAGEPDDPSIVDIIRRLIRDGAAS
ncbi:hypothetical protein AWB67_01925 [Caballeronia terrestris]|jgi:hypothetical protein|uniref:Uncharacterized protein n=1 Tax=Caballeronia terrestris TaxID=1226301 RepID=A0A158HMD4_9BURK|nr:hypothetical protein [Caballeronia terrestris]SAL45564.1 hypothetical protein AWB67_01925 [Caballeronia terrestris]